MCNTFNEKVLCLNVFIIIVIVFIFSVEVSFQQTSVGFIFIPDSLNCTKEPQKEEIIFPSYERGLYDNTILKIASRGSSKRMLLSTALK